ncbi:uncharacterized protein LOC133187717 [Saccostrea echinata]|uniref:uncharacterized protein LOC133187717 n=1 Tax=Saccostrea echinata TaxID=191078 RepID=UPI002A82F1AB|nr:uncharacterized protein LOC133187717 [Saccostrea echinata]
MEPSGSTLTVVVVLLFFVVFVLLCILRCRMKRSEHKDHDLYNLFFSRSAHSGSMLATDSHNLKKYTGSKKSRSGYDKEKRKHSLQEGYMERQSSSPNTRSFRLERCGSAPTSLLLKPFNMYKGNELIDRYRLFRCNSAPSCPLEHNGSFQGRIPAFTFSVENRFPEQKEPDDESNPRLE